MKKKLERVAIALFVLLVLGAIGLRVSWGLNPKAKALRAEFGAPLKDFEGGCTQAYLADRESLYALSSGDKYTEPEGPDGDQIMLQAVAKRNDIRAQYDLNLAQAAFYSIIWATHSTWLCNIDSGTTVTTMFGKPPEQQ